MIFSFRAPFIAPTPGPGRTVDVPPVDVPGEDQIVEGLKNPVIGRFIAFIIVFVLVGMGLTALWKSKPAFAVIMIGIGLFIGYAAFK